MTTAVQHSFAGGEISPTLYSRVDTQKYASGCKTLRNNIVTRSGAMMNRSGTTFCGEVKDSTKAVRLIPFQFNNAQTYVLEFGDLYVRFYQNGSQVLETKTSLTAITNASPGIITDTAHGYSTGDEIFISGIVGAIGTYLNNRNFKVVVSNANSYSLQYMDGSTVDTTSLGGYTSGGSAQRVYTVATIYTYVDVPKIKFAQSGDVMTLVHQNYPPQQLSRTATITNGLNVWTFSTMLFNPVTIGPLNGSTATQNEVQTGGAGFWTNGTPTSGSAVLTWNGTTSVLIAYNASNATIQSAVDTMVGGAGRCTVANQFTGLNAITFTFVGALAAAAQPLITCSIGFFNGFNTTNPQIHETTQGSTATGLNGAYTFKYKVTSINKVTGEESLPGLNGSVSISAVTTRGTNGTICQVTATSHGLSSGDEVAFNNMTAAGVPQLDQGRYIVTVLDANNFILNGVDSTTFGVYSSGGTMSYTFIKAANKAVPTAQNPITVVPGAVDNTVGLVNIYKQVNGVYGFMGTQKPATNFLDTNGPVDVTVQPPQFQTLFSTANNYPSNVVYYQQRLCFSNTYNSPMGFWASKVGKFNNFNIAAPGIPVADDDAVIFTLASEKVEPITNMADAGNLILFTSNNEFAVLGNNTGGQYGTLTPTAINVTIQSNYGSDYLRPIRVQGSLVYLQARQSILRDLIFKIEEDKYKGNDLTVFASHLFDTYTIKDMDYQQIPNTCIWAVRSDGTLLSATYNKEQDILAWAHHDTSGTFENVCVVPEGNSDSVYVVANRLVLTNGNQRSARYVERFQTRTVEISDTTKMLFMDSAGIFDGSNPYTTNSDLVLNGGYATTTTNTALNASSPTKITVRGWFKMSGNNYNNGLMTRSSLASSQGDWGLGFFTGNTNQIVWRVNGGNFGMTPVISQGVWHFVEANYDTNANVATIFLDGILVSYGVAGSAITNHANGLAIGNYYDTTMNYSFRGEMKEWEVCSNFIRNTGTVIGTSYYTPPSVITPDGNTTVCYHMTDGKGTTLADSSGNGITATITGNAYLGAETMTLTGGTNWNANEQLTLTSSRSYFTSAMVGDDIRVKLSDGTWLIFTIKKYTSATVVTVMSNKDVPAGYQGIAFSAWSRATKNISGAWWLENHAVSVLGDGYVLASPRDKDNYPLLVVTNGQITLPQNAAYVIVGCPYISDLKTLDIDVVGYSVFMGKTAIDKWKNISELTTQVVNTRGGFCGTESPDVNIQNSNNDPIFQLYEMKPRSVTDSVNLPPPLWTDNIKNIVAGGWGLHGNAFIRQVDPLPLCLSQVAMAGDVPLRDQDTNPPKGVAPNGR